MGRIYTVLMDAAAITGAKDIIRLSAPSDAVVIVHEITVDQQTDAGDAEAEMGVIQVHRASTDGTGTAATARALEGGSPAFGGTAVVNLTADATAGNILWRNAFNVQVGYQKLFTPEMRPVISPSGRLVVRLDLAPADSLTVSATMTFEEVGG